MSGGARRAAARHRVHNAVAGRIRIAVAIVAGGAFGALVVLWAGLGPSKADDGRTVSADERSCDVSTDCAPTTTRPVVTPGASVSSTPSTTSASTAPRMRWPGPTGPAVASGGSAGSPEPSTTPPADPYDPNDPGGPADPSASPSRTADPAPTSTSDDEVDVIVDLPPVVLPTCILDC